MHTISKTHNDNMSTLIPVILFTTIHNKGHDLHVNSQ